MAARGRTTTTANAAGVIAAPADPPMLAHLLRVERQAERQVARERKCAYGAVRLGKELRWVKEKHAYTQVKCASYDDWLRIRIKLRHSQAALYCAVAPLPLRLVRGRSLSLGRLQIIVKAPAWQWPVLCQHGHRPPSEARLRAAVAGGEEHLLAHQDQALALRHVQAVLEGADPFRQSPEEVPLEEAAAALEGALVQVKRAARALGELKDLAGQGGDAAKTGPWLARLIKAAAAADGEVQATVLRFRNPETEEPEAPAPPRARPPADEPPAAGEPAAAEAAAAKPAAKEPTAEEPTAAEPTAAEPAAAEPTAAEPAAAPATVRITDVCAALARELTVPEQWRLNAALVGLLLDDVPPQVLTAARAEVSALCDKARCAEGPGGLPATSLSSISAALQQDPIEGRWPVVFAVFQDEALAAARPALELVDPERVPAGYQEALRAALAERRPPPPRGDTERDAALAYLGGLVADKRAQILLDRKGRRC